MNAIFIVFILSVIAFFLGLFLAISSKVFHVQKPENLEKIENLLPGVNCGACGYLGCSGLALAIYNKENEPQKCPVATSEQRNKIALLMGLKKEEKELRNIAFIKCAGMKDEDVAQKFEYIGIDSCVMASLTAGGWKSCEYGCLKMGDCLKVCKFDAIRLGENNEPIINKEKCTSCGMCVDSCPRSLIELIPYKKSYMVACSSKDKGADTKKFCKKGCIACKLCQKACKFDAIYIENNLAYIDQSKCIGCGLCVKACPQNVIEFIDGKAIKLKVAKKKTTCNACGVC
jgi:Na+-translocating ferredoxin:NAD+ oxidoreductase subunit B